MTKDEALKKAFKQAFQLGQDYWYQADHEYVSQNKKSDVTRAKFEQLMEDAIKEALAQPEQEPVAYIRVSKTGHVMACAKTGDFYSLPHKTLLYTAPPQRKPLSDEEIERIYDRYGGNMTNCARAIERAHGIKGKA